MKTIVTTVLIAMMACTVYAQKKVDFKDLTQFSVENRKLESVIENGRPVIKINEAPGGGLAILNNVTFESGTIEFDVKGRNVPQQSFVGIAFLIQDKKTYDAIYFRPFNFMNADTARRHRAVQYISHPEFTWERLREQHPGKYEAKISPAPDPEAWIHAKIVVDGKKVAVYVNGSTSPSLEVVRLTDARTGKVGLWVGNDSNASFADLQITNASKKAAN